MTSKTKSVTKEQATTLLMRDVQCFEDVVCRLVKVDLSQNQYDALVSWLYNLGEGNFKKSSLLKNLNISPTKITKKHFTAWNKADGKVLPGLTKRREKEYALFIS